MVGLSGTLLTAIPPKCNRAGIYLEISTIGNKQPSGVTPVESGGALFMSGSRRLVRYHRPSARCLFIVGVLTKTQPTCGIFGGVCAEAARDHPTAVPPSSV